ncbi:hypothetical protein IAQ61_002068 [Plenodomus lingam]|uniref:uncharacterized protein n=1 Tax=Leptosphaeria maculans TaxID=5022 RepID=UPI0033206B1A|nr:hypothetical protein IAQ61_002068 [Plenodomus lingam]
MPCTKAIQANHKIRPEIALRDRTHPTLQYPTYATYRALYLQKASVVLQPWSSAHLGQLYLQSNRPTPARLAVGNHSLCPDRHLMSLESVTKNIHYLAVVAQLDFGVTVGGGVARGVFLARRYRYTAAMHSFASQFLKGNNYIALDRRCEAAIAQTRPRHSTV